MAKVTRVNVGVFCAKHIWFELLHCTPHLPDGSKYDVMN